MSFFFKGVGKYTHKLSVFYRLIILLSIHKFFSPNMYHCDCRIVDFVTFAGAHELLDLRPSKLTGTAPTWQSPSHRRALAALTSARNGQRFEK